jgi:hypothetical protein
VKEDISMVISSPYCLSLRKGGRLKIWGWTFYDISSVDPPFVKTISKKEASALYGIAHGSLWH